MFQLLLVILNEEPIILDEVSSRCALLKLGKPAFLRTWSSTKGLLRCAIHGSWKALATCLSTAQYRSDLNRIPAIAERNKHSKELRVKELPLHVAKTISKTCSFILDL